jgi:hypothetical protein
MRQACTIARGNTAVAESGSPFSPSQTMLITSLTPRFARSASTDIQNFADSPPPAPTHMPSTLRRPCRSTPIAA